LDANGDGLAIDRQREDCRAIAQLRGWTIVREYADKVSASDKRKARPEYNDLVHDYADGRFDALVCWDLDRLTRQPRQLEDWIDAATDRGLLLVTANGEADLSTDAGRLFARIKASVARAEVERKSARQARAALQRSEHGRPPLGVRLTGYTVSGGIIEYESAIVRQVFDRFAAGDSLKGIATWLTAAGIPTRRGSRRWNPSTVSGMLRNPRYAGRAIYRGEETGKSGAWEPLVSDDTFSVVQARLDDPRRKTNREGTDRKYLGSSLYVCSVCGTKVYSWGGKRYRCVNACFTRSQGSIDSFVIGTIRERLARSDVADLVADDTSDDARRIGAEVKRLRRRIAAIADDYDAGRIDGQRYAIATEKVRAELSAAESAQARLGLDRSTAGILTAPDPVVAFDNAPLMARRTVLDALMTVAIHPAPRGRKAFDPESVEITWRQP
jgi:DNA invertase Pin-like site-specific DNA recombinase